ncbi:MAG: LD-carboxypeptidase [Polyangiaceae bacterium]
MTGDAFVFPPALKPGSRIAVVAPASPFDHALIWRGLGALGERYRLRFDRALFTRTGYLAGSDERRRDELARALEAPDVDAIVAARGGYGLTRFVHELPWQKLRERPRWLIGFSDITALHVEAMRLGVASLHAPNLSAFGGQGSARASVIAALENPRATRRFEGLIPLVAGRASGPLVGGNLTLIMCAATMGRWAPPAGAILFIEDVTERPYRIDRALSALRAGGHLDRIGGLVVGDFTDCNPGPDGVTVESVIADYARALAVPAARGLPAGHGTVNEPLMLGARATLDVGSSAQLEI